MSCSPYIALRAPYHRVGNACCFRLCVAPLRVRSAGIVPVDPGDILYEGMYKYHGSAQVTVLGRGYQCYIYIYVCVCLCVCVWGSKGVYRGRGSWLLVAMEYYYVLIYDDVSQFGVTREVPGVGTWYLWLVRCGQGGNEGLGPG